MGQGAAEADLSRAQELNFLFSSFSHRVWSPEVSQVLGSLLCFPVDAAVEDGHDRNRDVEGGNGSAESDVVGSERNWIWHSSGGTVRLPNQVLPTEDRGGPEDEGSARPSQS